MLLAAFATAQLPQTESEASGFQRHTSREAMLGYLREVSAASSEMRLGVYGSTREGRELVYAVLSRPGISQPHEAVLLNRPVVLLAANVHGNERTLRESLLVLMREFATPGTEMSDLLDKVVVLVVPQINPDGFEATQRGIRGNAWGIDLNRDYVKLEHPSIADLISNLVHPWRPHIFVDGHNGGSYPYNVNYQGPSNAAVDPRITALCDREIFPLIDKQMEEAGYKSFYYSGGNATRWSVGGAEPRIGRNYAGMANIVGILFESPGGQDLRTGAESGVVAFKAVLRFARDNAERLMATVRDASLETIRLGAAGEGQIPVTQRYEAEDERVGYEIAVGQGEARRLQQVTDGLLMKKPVPTRLRDRPYAYLLPRDAEAAVAMLRRHGIVVERLEGETQLEVQAYPMEEIGYERAYNHAAAVRLTVGDPVTARRTFPRGTYLVRTGQTLGRLASFMLEPETSDNVIYWNTMDAWLPKTQMGGEAPALVPIYKLMRPTPLAARLL
jgi:dipeptidyl-peptidase 4